MSDLLQEFADSITEGIRKHADESRERATLKRMNELCDEVDKVVAARPVPFWDDFVRHTLEPAKTPCPRDVLTFASIPPIGPDDDDDFLAACRRAGFLVKGSRVCAKVKKVEQARRRRHVRHYDLHCRLLDALTQLCFATLETKDV